MPKVFKPAPIKRRNSLSCRHVLLGTIVCAFSSVSGAQSAKPAPELSPQARAYLEKAKTGNLPAMDLTDAELLGRTRTMLEQIFTRQAQIMAPDFEPEAVDMNGVTGYWIDRSEKPAQQRAILYLHGGGYVLGSATSNLTLPLRISRLSGLRVLSVEYRLAPEHTYPAALDDAVAAYQWLLDAGYPASQLAVFGDSAGGGLTLNLALELMRREIPLPAAVAVISPLTDLDDVGDTQHTLADEDPVLRSFGSSMYGLYAGDLPLDDPRVSPVYADYAGFPPLLIQVGTRERFLSDAARLARAARDADVDVTLDVWDSMWHVWSGNPDLPEAEAASAALAAFMVERML